MTDTSKNRPGVKLPRDCRDPAPRLREFWFYFSRRTAGAVAGLWVFVFWCRGDLRAADRAA
jgi:hypothetical protein